MANTSIFAAFERMWQHTISALSSKAEKSEIPTTADDISAVSYATQTLTEAEKQQVRDNIGVNGYATETYVNAKIAEAQLGGGDTDLSAYYTKDETYNRTEVDNRIPTSLSELTTDATHRLVTDAEKFAWNAKADASDIPTKVSELTNDSGYLVDIPDEVYGELKDYMDDQLQIAKDSGEFNGAKGVSVINIRIEEVSL